MTLTTSILESLQAESIAAQERRINSMAGHHAHLKATNTCPSLQEWTRQEMADACARLYRMRGNSR